MVAEQTGRPFDTGPAFHWRDGWFFARVTEPGDMLGAVKITMKREGGLVQERFIPPNEWASIVAAVTPEGDNATTYRLAVGLHG